MTSPAHLESPANEPQTNQYSWRDLHYKQTNNSRTLPWLDQTLKNSNQGSYSCFLFHSIISLSQYFFDRCSTDRETAVPHLSDFSLQGNLFVFISNPLGNLTCQVMDIKPADPQIPWFLCHSDNLRMAIWVEAGTGEKGGANGLRCTTICLNRSALRVKLKLQAG